MARTYRIRTHGLKEGFGRKLAAARLMTLFKQPVASIQPILDVQGTLIREGMDRVTALRYKEALERCGCLCLIEEDGTPIIKDLTPGQYAALFQSELREIEPNRRWQWDDASASLSSAATPGATYPCHLVVPIGPLHEEWLKASPGSRSHLMRCAAGVVLLGNSPRQLEEIKKRLRPIVRSCADRSNALLEGASHAPTQVHRPLAEGLEILLCCNWPGVMEYVTHGQLDVWGWSEDEAFDLAYANLRAHSAKPMQQCEGGVWAGEWSDEEDSARMLLPDMLQQHVSGQAVVMVPARGCLLLVGDDSEPALAAMLKRAIPFLQLEHIVAPGMLRLVRGKWQPFAPAELTRRLNSMRKHAEALEYQRQHDTLQARLDLGRERLQVGSYIVGRMGAEQVRASACKWMRGAFSLLPRTDFMRFSDPADESWTITVPWDVAQPIIGALMEKTEHWPPRYKVMTFPDPMQLEQLREAEERARLDALPPVPEPEPAVQRFPWMNWLTMLFGRALPAWRR